MRATAIHVAQLFGIFSHEIRFRLDERVTIMHGPNGMGKTVILRMIDSVAHGSWDIFRQVPFRRIAIDFDDGRTIAISRKNAITDEEVSLTVETAGEIEDVSILVPSSKSPRVHRLLTQLEREISYIYRAGEDLWIDRRDEERMNFERLLEVAADEAPEVVNELRQARSNLPVESFQSFKTLLIGTDRLYRDASRRRPTRNELLFSPRRGENQAETVVGYAAELRAEIKTTTSEYGSIAAKLDRTFPVRLLSKAPPPSGSSDELERRLKQLSSERNRLRMLGLVDLDEDLQDDLGKLLVGSASSDKINALAIYIRDAEEKLLVFRELAQKVEVFLNIINSRFRYKRIDVETSSGFSLIDIAGKALAPRALSSGEQHLVVLLYQLLFKTPPSTLLLIDEPEISLHLSWQEQLISDVMSIASICDFDTLMATHSSELVGSFWRLTEQLAGPDMSPEKEFSPRERAEK